MTLIQADAFHLPYPDKLFHACVTSPPYWGLRKYAGEQGEEPLGLEATPERHIERMVEIFREVRRVLRDDGVVWLNYGDCFSGSGKGPQGESGIGNAENRMGFHSPGRKDILLQGNLMLMPHRLAIALQDNGWIVRNDLVWFKRNPMPESVAGWRWEKKREIIGDDPKREGNPMPGKGAHRSHSGRDFAQPEYEYSDDYVLRKSSWRHTRAHEYVFQLVKKMGYFCNQEAVRVPSSKNTHHRGTKLSPPKEAAGADAGHGHRDFAELTPDILPKRNPRSVLDVPTAPYKGAHYATFPPKLIAPLIRASVPRRCCPECGMAWAPVVEKKGGTQGSWHNHEDDNKIGMRAGKRSGNVDSRGAWEDGIQSTVTDYRPTCECGLEDFEPGIVLDIFGGSGTTGMVAKQLLRRWVVMDISRPYLDEQSKIRTGTGTPSNALEGLPLFEDTEC